MKVAWGMLLALAFMFAASVNATIVSGTWNFTASGGYSGSFSFSGLDTTQDYTNSTAAGFSVSTNFDTTGDGGNAFSYDTVFGNLRIGGLVDGVNSLHTSPPFVNDFVLLIQNISTTPTFYQFSYVPASGFTTSIAGTVTRATVPEPATLMLLGIGLAGIGFARRRRTH